MKLNLFSLTSTMESLGVPLEKRPELLTVSLARAMSYKLPVPSMPVESAKEYYKTYHQESVQRVLARINERVVFDLDRISELVCAIWMFRYELAHDPFNSALRDFLDAMLKVGGRSVPAEVSEFMIHNDDDRLLDKVARAVDETLVPEPQQEA